MFDNTRSAEFVDISVEDTGAVSAVELVLQKSSLPDAVRSAPVSRVFERLIDAREIERLTQPSPHSEDNPAVLDKLEIRRKALTNYLGTSLTCLLIHLPGAFYTVEIDTALMKVVHWEWQRQ